MTAPAGVVDLSLPDYPTLVARAGVDPRAEAARVAAADPGAVAGAGALLGRAGGEMDGAYTSSLGAADTLGRAFTNDGAPVLDRATHVGNLPAGFGDAGARLAGTSRRVGAVADDLTATMRLTADAVTGLDRDLSAAASSWAARVAAAGTVPNSGGGLIPQEAVPALLAERDRIATQMAGMVADAGRRVVDRIRGYEVVVNEALRLLADHGLRAAGRAGRAASAPACARRGRRSGRPGHPADGRVRRGPGEHRARELRRGRDGPAVRRAARRADVRPHLQLPLRPVRPVRCPLGVLGHDPAGRAHLDRRVRGPGRAAGRLPAHRLRVRAGRRRRRARGAVGRGTGAGVVRRPALGVRRGRTADAYLGRSRHVGPVRPRRATGWSSWSTSTGAR